MAARRQAHDEEAWRNAKKICQLSAQQVEMARALGMNPKKLPRLRAALEAPGGRVHRRVLPEAIRRRSARPSPTSTGAGIATAGGRAQTRDGCGVAAEGSWKQFSA